MLFEIVALVHQNPVAVALLLMADEFNLGAAHPIQRYVTEVCDVEFDGHTRYVALFLMTNELNIRWSIPHTEVCCLDSDD